MYHLAITHYKLTSKSINCGDSATMTSISTTIGYEGTYAETTENPPLQPDTETTLVQQDTTTEKQWKQPDTTLEKPLGQPDTATQKPLGQLGTTTAKSGYPLGQSEASDIRFGLLLLLACLLFTCRYTAPY